MRMTVVLTRKTLAFLVMTLIVLFATSAAGQFRNAHVGEKPPDFTLVGSDGESYSLSDYKDNWTIVTFLKIGQEKSENIVRDLVKLDPKVLDSVYVLLIVTNPAEGNPAEWAKNLGLGVPVLVDSDKEAYGAWGVVVTPQTSLIAPDGKIIEILSGHNRTFGKELNNLCKLSLGLITKEELAEQEEKTLVVEKSPETKAAERLLGKARMLVKRKMWEKAKVNALKAVETDPNHVESRIFVGTVMLESDPPEYADAETHFQKALELDPNNAEAKLGQARAMAGSGRGEEAIKFLETEIKITPKPEKLYYYLGQAHESGKDWEKAAVAYRKALERFLKP